MQQDYQWDTPYDQPPPEAPGVDTSNPPPGYHWEDGVGWVPNQVDPTKNPTRGGTQVPRGDTDNPLPPPPPPPPGGGSGMPSGALANYSVPPPVFPNEPAYTPTTFTPPSAADALADPYYQAESKAGTDALQRWAAYKGTVNDTGTANALQDYGLNSATQRLGDVWGRAFTGYQANERAQETAYGMNRQSQYIDPWTAQYNAWAQQGNWYLQNQGTVAGTALGFAQL